MSLIESGHHMSIHFICPVCKAKHTSNDQDAGKKSDCKKCGQRLQVPTPQRAKTILGEESPPTTPEPRPEPPAEPPPPKKDYRESDLEYRPEPDDRPRRRRNTRRKMSTVNLLMLIFTGMWLIGMPCFGCGIMTTGPQSKEVGAGYVLVEHANGRRELKKENEHIAGLMTNGILAGLCCPTIPYGIAMLVLLIVRSTTKTGA